MADREQEVTKGSLQESRNRRLLREGTTRTMAPLFSALKSIRRASRHSFKTAPPPSPVPEHDTASAGESSSDADAASNGTAPTSGSITPPSISAQSDPALNLSLPTARDDDGPYNIASRPPMPGQRESGFASGSNRYSMYGAGSGSVSTPPGTSPPPKRPSRGKYAPRILNIEDRTFVSDPSTPETPGVLEPVKYGCKWESLHRCKLLTSRNRFTKSY